MPVLFTEFFSSCCARRAYHAEETPKGLFGCRGGVFFRAVPVEVSPIFCAPLHLLPLAFRGLCSLACCASDRKLS